MNGCEMLATDTQFMLLDIINFSGIHQKSCVYCPMSCHCGNWQIGFQPLLSHFVPKNKQCQRSLAAAYQAVINCNGMFMVWSPGK